MAKLTNQQWKDIEGAITLYHPVYLKIDGANITIHLHASKVTMKMSYLVYVNGEIKGEWFDKSSEIGKKYFCPKSQWSITIKQEKKIIRAYGKKAAKEAGLVREKRIYMFEPYFDSFRTLKSVLVNNNQDFEIIKL